MTHMCITQAENLGKWYNGDECFPDEQQNILG